MNRLAPLQHALRAARPSAARASSSARPLAHGARIAALPSGRRYASNTAKTSTANAPSKKTVLTPPSPEFERILASLRPGLEREDIAKRVAALFLLTEKKNEIEAVEKKLHSLLEGKHFEEVSARIKHYCRIPQRTCRSWQRLAPAWTSSEAEAALSEVGLTTFDYLNTLMESDMSVRVLNALDGRSAEAVEYDWVSYKETRKPESLEKLLQFFSNHGLDFVPPSKDNVAEVKMLRSMSKIDETPIIPESELEQESEEDVILRASNAARTPSSSPFQTVSRLSSQEDFPDLMQPHPALDPKDVVDYPPTEATPYFNRVIVRNHRSVFHDYSKEEPDIVETADEFVAELPVNKGFYDSLHQSILIRRGVVQQTGKGKIRRVSFTVLLGNADGLVGLGEGKHANSMVALKSARIDAIRNMDWVERFEKRTVWTEMRTKLGGTELILRPRPVGFGLRCNPYLHQILRAAGFKDISAKVWGSRNKMNVIKAAFRMLQAGHAPTGMGDGLGGPGKKLSKGSGLIGKEEVERARGRKLIPLRK
ncbi:37S ribosomal protein S5 [Coprinopsis sp. MPI-PUGE-AT-0042]|nr:37S ribosomal protein S5 [Coprinopsis sp. MPI-PUGE-AT-0042]